MLIKQILNIIKKKVYFDGEDDIARNVIVEEYNKNKFSFSHFRK